MVNNVIESCKNDQKITPIFLYGVSGSGKTKTLYDVLKENFGIFFDFNPELIRSDLILFKNIIDQIIKNYKKEDIEKYRLVIIVIKILLLSRILTLLLLLFKRYVKNPEDWLYIQINTQTYEILTISLQYIFSILKNETQIDEIINSSLKWLKKISQKEFICTLDEAHCLLR
jgi:Cdc6-like AAA superfamily ATPase